MGARRIVLPWRWRWAMGIAPSCQWTVKLRRVMLPTCPTPSAVSSEKTLDGLRPWVLARRRGGAAPGGDRPPPGPTADEGQDRPERQRSQRMPRRDLLMPALDALVHRRAPNAGVNSANLAAVRSIRNSRSTYHRALVNNPSSSAC